LISPANN